VVHRSICLSRRGAADAERGAACGGRGGLRGARCGVVARALCADTAAVGPEPSATRGGAEAGCVGADAADLAALYGRLGGGVRARRHIGVPDPATEATAWTHNGAAYA